MKQKANRRQLKNYFVVNKFHFKLLIVNLIYVLLIFTAIICVVLIPFYRDIFQVNDIYTQHFSAKFFIALLNRSSIALLVLLVFSVLYQVMINHKVCGPLVNFSNTFQKITRGDLTRKIFLRRHDFLKHEAAQVNDMIDSLSERIMILKNDHERILSTLENMSEVDAQDGFQNMLQNLKKHIEIYTGHLSEFKTDEMDDRKN